MAFLRMINMMKTSVKLGVFCSALNWLIPRTDQTSPDWLHLFHQMMSSLWTGALFSFLLRHVFFLLSSSIFASLSAWIVDFFLTFIRISWSHASRNSYWVPSHAEHMYVVRYDTYRPCQCQISGAGIIWVEGSILSVWNVWRNPMPHRTSCMSPFFR